ncbi:MAG: hypothetical protein JSR80_03960 [Verrucomicrobia bacterium]|nr:hypothetical protein [Verrucomicrobiota bacterium]
MFNWLVAIFMLVSLVVLFIGWTKLIRVKEIIRGTEAQVQWTSLRIMVFVAMLVEVILLIVALLGARAFFSYLCPLFLIYFSVVVLFLVNFFLSSLEACSSKPGISKKHE